MQPKASEVNFEVNFEVEVEVEVEAEAPAEVGKSGSTATTRRSGAYHGPPLAAPALSVERLSFPIATPSTLTR